LKNCGVRKTKANRAAFDREKPQRRTEKLYRRYVSEIYRLARQGVPTLSFATRMFGGTLSWHLGLRNSSNLYIPDSVKGTSNISWQKK
jgi:hypothetical protein